MLLDLKFSIGTLGIGAGTLICSLYGMNLKNFIEDSDFAFAGVSTWAFLFSSIICAYGLHKLRRTQRLTMWGEGGANGKKGWLTHLPHPHHHPHVAISKPRRDPPLPSRGPPLQVLAHKGSR